MKQIVKFCVVALMMMSLTAVFGQVPTNTKGKSKIIKQDAGVINVNWLDYQIGVDLQKEVSNGFTPFVLPSHYSTIVSIQPFLKDNPKTADKVEESKRFALSLDLSQDPARNGMSLPEYQTKDVPYSPSRVIIFAHTSEEAKQAYTYATGGKIYDPKKVREFIIPRYVPNQNFSIMVKNSSTANNVVTEGTATGKASSSVGAVKVTIGGNFVVVPKDGEKPLMVTGSDFAEIEVGVINEGVVVCKKTIYKPIIQGEVLEITAEDVDFSKDEKATVVVSNGSKSPFVIYALNAEGEVVPVTINNGDSKRVKLLEGENCLTVVTSSTKQRSFLLKEAKIVLANYASIHIDGPGKVKFD